MLSISTHSRLTPVGAAQLWTQGLSSGSWVQVWPATMVMAGSIGNMPGPVSSSADAASSPAAAANRAAGAASSAAAQINANAFFIASSLL